MKLISGNSKVVRNINRAIILNLIRNKQPISRTKLAKLAGLNKSTVSSIVADLLQEQIIDEQLVPDQNIGRNPFDLSLKTGKYLVGAVNIDSSFTRFAIVDIDGTFVAESTIKTIHKEPNTFIEHCVEHLERMQSENGIEKLCGIGFSIAGIVDANRLIVKYAPNLEWENFKIGEAIRSIRPHMNLISIGNDAKTSALAEQWFGSKGQQLSNFVFLTVGEGIGSGIVLDHKIINGETNASGEFGHITIFEDGEPCSCGNSGCWESYASDRATVARYLSKKKDVYTNGSVLTIDDIIKAAKNDDQAAKEVLAQKGYYLGIGITIIIRTIDLHAIIIDGKITEAWEFIYPEIFNLVSKRAPGYQTNPSLIRPTSLTVQPSLLGAATLIIKELFDDYKIVV